VWFHRIISGLASSENAEHPNVLKYVDYGPNGVDSNDEAHPQVLLHNLKNKKMKEAWTKKTFSHMMSHGHQEAILAKFCFCDKLAI